VGRGAVDRTGQRRDGTGLLFYLARYDDPRLGRFLSADSVGVHRAHPRTRDHYSHTLNNPLEFIDPTGHRTDTPQNNEDRAVNRRGPGRIGAIADLREELPGSGTWKAGESETLLADLRDRYAASGRSRAAFFRTSGGRRPSFERIQAEFLAANFRGTNDRQSVVAGDGCAPCGGADARIPLPGAAFRHGDLRARSQTAPGLARRWMSAAGGDYPGAWSGQPAGSSMVMD